MQEAIQHIGEVTGATKDTRTSISVAPLSPEASSASMDFGPEVKCMDDILRFLQLLCENHNSALQVCGEAKILHSMCLYILLELLEKTRV